MQRDVCLQTITSQFTYILPRRPIVKRLKQYISINIGTWPESVTMRSGNKHGWKFRFNFNEAYDDLLKTWEREMNT